MRIWGEETKELVGEQLVLLTKALIKEFALLPQGESEFREIFGKTMWMTLRKRPEDLLKTIELVESE